MYLIWIKRSNCVEETGIQNYQWIGLDLKLLPSPPQVTFTYKPISSHPRPHQTPHTTRRARHCTCLAQDRRSPTPGGGRNAAAPAPVRLAHSPPSFLIPAPFVRSSLGTVVLGPPGSEGMRCLFQFSFPFFLFLATRIQENLQKSGKLGFGPKPILIQSVGAW